MGKQQVYTASYLFLLLLVFVKTVTAGEIRPIPGVPLVNFSIPGHLNLGVVISLHKPNASVLCGETMREIGALQRLESIVFAVEEINARNDILPDVTLGFTVVDDCNNDLTALSRSLHFVQNTSSAAQSGDDSFPPIEAVGLIGAEGSTRTIQIADMLSMFEVPQLSYASSSAMLDDKTKYSFFSRTVPSDTLQAQAIVDILQRFNWTYVSLLYAEGSYGSEGYKAIKNRMESIGYCLAVVLELRDDFSDQEFDVVVHKLMDKKQAKVVVLFTTQYQAKGLFSAFKRRHEPCNFTWVGGDSISMNAHFFQEWKDIAAGTLSVNFVSQPVDRFEEYFKTLTLRNGTRNPWFADFFASFFGCDPNLTSGTNACDLDLQIKNASQYKPETTASLSINAVYAMAYALHNLTAGCPDRLTDPRHCITPTTLRDTLRRVKFNGESANISFDAQGNGQSSYEIRCLALEDDVLVLRKIGKWDPASLDFVSFHEELITWKPGLLESSGNGPSVYPVSVCSDSCRVGYQAVTTQPSCCWYCEKCRSNERTVLRSNLPKCERCPGPDNFTWPDPETRTECLPIPAEYVDVFHIEGGLLLAFDFVVFSLTCAVGVAYWKHKDNRLIKASSRELSIMMLGGHVFSCLLVITFVLEPSTVTCVLCNIGFHLSITVSYSPLLVKTNRIFRIFMAGKSTTRKPPLIGSRAQVLITLCLIGIQALLMCIWMAIEHPEARTEMSSLNEKLVERFCTVPEAGFLVSLLFNLLLIVVCAAHAFKTRRLPANFNEAKFITFTIYTTILLWLSFFPTYFTSSSYKVKVLCLTIAMMFNVISCQVFLFLPKLYAVYFVDEENLNVRENRTTTNPSNNSQLGEIPGNGVVGVNYNRNSISRIAH